MLSRYSVLIMILGCSVFLEAVFLLLFRNQIPQTAISLALVLGTVTMVYIFVGISFTAIRNRNLGGLSVTRVMSARRMHVAEFTYVEITVKNPTTGRFDAVRIVDYYPESFSIVDGSNCCAVTLPPYSTVSFAYILRANERGSYRIGNTEIYAGDPCGYTLDYRKFENGTRIVVYPPVAKHVKKRLRKPSEQKTTGTKFAKKKGRGFDYVGSRRYITGDEIKLIDWKYLAKTAEPGTKEFHVERNIDVMLVIDCSESMNTSTGRETKLDACADGCTYLAYQFLKQGDSVGVMACGPKKSGFIPPGHGNEAYHRVLSTIASIEGESGKTDIFKYIAHSLKSYQTRTIFFIFTDNSDASELVRTANLIREFKHDVVFIIPFIDVKHYGNTLYLSEAKRHNPVYVSALAHVLFIDEAVRISAVVDRLKKLGVKSIVASTDDLNREIVLKLGTELAWR